MATKKISELSTTTTPASGALFPIVQSSDNFAVTLENIAANLPAVTATSITSSTTITATSGFVGDLTGDVTGNADTATALATGRTIGMTGDVTWTSSSFDGTGNVTGTAAIGTGVIVNADVNTSAAIDATKIHDGTVSNTEFGYLNGVSSAIQSQIDTKITASSTDTLTNKTFDANGTGNSLSNVEVADLASGVLDTDLSSVSASDDTLASAKAIKTYVDSQVTAQDLDFQADSGGALSIDLDSETLTFTGGTGIDTTGSGNAVTFAIDSTVTTLTGSQTLTNKTLTTPVISSISNTGTLTLPTSTDTLVGRATTDTLTNKTINSASNTITITESNISDLGSYITASSTDTLTNKTFDVEGTGNSISNIDVADFKAAAIVTESEGISSNDNDTTLPTSAAVKDYADTKLANVVEDTTPQLGGDLDTQTNTIDLSANTASLKLNKGTTAQRDGSPSSGMFRFNTTTTTFEGYDGSAWGAIGGGGGATGAGGDEVFVENERVVTTSYTLSTSKSASCVGPLTINSGVTVTIPSGERLVIL